MTELTTLRAADPALVFAIPDFEIPSRIQELVEQVQTDCRQKQALYTELRRQIANMLGLQERLINLEVMGHPESGHIHVKFDLPTRTNVEAAEDLIQCVSGKLGIIGGWATIIPAEEDRDGCVIVSSLEVTWWLVPDEGL